MLGIQSMQLLPLHSLLAISDRDELHFEEPWYLFRAVPPQSNYLSADVLPFREVSNIETKGQCYIVLEESKFILRSEVYDIALARTNVWDDVQNNVMHFVLERNNRTYTSLVAIYILTPLSLARKLLRLLPTLYNHFHTATTDCSKANRWSKEELRRVFYSTFSASNFVDL